MGSEKKEVRIRGHARLPLGAVATPGVLVIKIEDVTQLDITAVLLCKHVIPVTDKTYKRSDGRLRLEFDCVYDRPDDPHRDIAISASLHDLGTAGLGAERYLTKIAYEVSNPPDPQLMIELEPI